MITSKTIALSCFPRRKELVVTIIPNASSFNAVWSHDRRLTVEEAGNVYTQLCQGNTSALTSAPTSRKAIAAFLAELTSKYPQIDDATEDEVDDCPWNAAFDQSDAHLIIPMVWSRAAEVAPYVKILAYKHGLICYDPQENSVQLPPFRQTSI